VKYKLALQLHVILDGRNRAPVNASTDKELR
jgi:hypothetical protein